MMDIEDIEFATEEQLKRPTQVQKAFDNTVHICLQADDLEISMDEWKQLEEEMESQSFRFAKVKTWNETPPKGIYTC